MSLCLIFLSTISFVNDSDHFISIQGPEEEKSQPQWPEDGGEWSDGEEGTNMDCGLLQAMAEEDEEINVYNDETFGMGVWTPNTVSKFPQCNHVVPW